MSDNKKILLVTQVFNSLEQVGASRHYMIAKKLTEKGCKVDVLTTYVNYIERVIRHKYKFKFCVHEKKEELDIYRTYSYSNYGSFIISRLLNYFSFTICAILVGLVTLRKNNYDIIYVSSPPLFTGVVGVVLSYWFKSRYIFEVRDLWPDSAVMLGKLKNKKMIRLTRFLEYWIYKKSNVIIGLTEGICEGIKKKISQKTIKCIPNAIDVDIFENGKSIKLPVETNCKTTVVYSGAHGVNNTLELIIKLAYEVKSCEDIHFLIVGYGEATDHLKKLVKHYDLKNVTFMGLMPKIYIPAILKKSDICIWPVGNKTHKIKMGALPNKLFDYLYSGKPILTNVHPDSEAGKIIKKFNSGVICDDNISSWKEGLFDIIRNYNEYLNQCHNNLPKIKRMYDRNNTINNLLRVIDEL